jgi:hypothetical protein
MELCSCGCEDDDVEEDSDESFKNEYYEEDDKLQESFITTNEVSIEEMAESVVEMVLVGEKNYKDFTEQESKEIASNNVEPPGFATKSYEEYKEDLKMWSRLTSLDRKDQAEMAVYWLTGHPSKIKEKIMARMGTEQRSSIQKYE